MVPVSSRRSLSEEPENDVVGIGRTGGGGVLQEPLVGLVQPNLTYQYIHVPQTTAHSLFEIGTKY